MYFPLYFVILVWFFFGCTRFYIPIPEEPTTRLEVWQDRFFVFNPGYAFARFILTPLFTPIIKFLEEDISK